MAALGEESARGRQSNEISRKNPTSRTDRFREVFATLTCVSLYPSSVELFTQGWPADEVYLIEEGVIKLNRTSRDGIELTVSIRGAGDVLGTAAAILGDPHPTSATTVTSCRLYRVPAKAFVSILQADAGMSWYVQQMHCREVLDQIARVEEFGSHSARQRLERLICTIASNSDQTNESNGKGLQIPLRQFEIAALVGTG